MRKRTTFTPGAPGLLIQCARNGLVRRGKLFKKHFSPVRAARWRNIGAIHEPTGVNFVSPASNAIRRYNTLVDYFLDEEVRARVHFLRTLVHARTCVCAAAWG